MLKRSFHRAATRFAVVALIVGSAPTSAFAGWATAVQQAVNTGLLTQITSLNSQQVANQGVQIENQVTQIENQLTQIDNQLDMYNNMLQNTEKLPVQTWEAASKDLMGLVNTSRAALGIAHEMAVVEDVLRDRFASYDDMSKDMEDGKSIVEQYEKWSKATRNALIGAVNAANMDAKTFETETATLAKLRALASSADGQMQALEIGNELAAQQIEQSQKLRHLVNTQISQMSTWALSMQGNSDAAQAESEHTFGVNVNVSVKQNPSGGSDVETEVEFDKSNFEVQTDDGERVGVER